MGKWKPTLTQPHDVRNAWFIWMAVAVAVVIFCLATDFKRDVAVRYMDTARAWLNSAELYEPGIHGFLYLPAAGVLMIPFEILPKSLGWSLFRLAEIALFAFGIHRFGLLLGRSSGIRLFPLMTLLAILPTSLNAFRNGQMTVPMIGCMLLAAACMADARWWRSVFWIALAVALKPLAMVFLLLAVVIEPRLRWRLPLGLLVVLLMPFLFQSPGYVVDVYVEFVQKMQRASAPGFNTNFSDVFGLTRVFSIDLSSTVMTVIRLIAAVGALAAAWLARSRFGRVEGAIFMVMLAAFYILLFNPRTENNTYVLIVPIIGGIIASSFLVGRWLLSGILFAICLLVINANHEISRWITPDNSTWLNPLVAVFMVVWVLALIPMRRSPWNDRLADQSSTSSSSGPMCDS